MKTPLQLLAEAKAMFDFFTEQRKRYLDKSLPPQIAEGAEPTPGQQAEMLKKDLDFYQRAHRLAPNLDDVWTLLEPDLTPSMERLMSPGTPNSVTDFDRGVLRISFLLLDRIRNAEKNLAAVQLRLTRAQAEMALSPELSMEPVPE